ncbi:hypothetical protein JOQ06_011023 [Pogonophryne albipinna]|uniref:Cytochrome P450 2K1 n=1 Tax=Pogonophryne albipinna TaxID=1090488 RepID=A0AAD6FG57_9TELE|nr:hypothetical protein JOQ06_011023 [Pogonophryne albipinna]
MSLWHDFVLIFFSNPTTLLGLVALLLILYLVSSSLITKEIGKEPPGPRPLPLLGNLLQLDLKRPYKTLCELSKKYGSVFTVYFGTNKVVVLAGYKSVKNALVSNAEEFGEREISPIFYDMNEGHGILFANGESWKELRRFALSTLRDFGMGKRIAEQKILEECHHLTQMFEDHKGKPFDTARPLNHATSNIISSIVYGSRFEYNDPRFKEMVRRANQTICIVGSAQIQLYNMFPRLLSWIKNRHLLLQNVEMTTRDVKALVKNLKETLNPSVCRGLVDCFLIRKKKEEDSGVKDTHYNEKNLICTVTNLFAAGTDTTATTLRWGLLLMAKYPHRAETRSVGTQTVELKVSVATQLSSGTLKSAHVRSKGIQATVSFKNVGTKTSTYPEFTLASTPIKGPGLGPSKRPRLELEQEQGETSIEFEETLDSSYHPDDTVEES